MSAVPPPPPPPPPAGYPGGALPPNPAANYASWGARVGSYLIDYIPVMILTGIGYAILFGSMAGTATCVDTANGVSCVSSGASAGATIFSLIFFAAGFVFWLWNRVFKMGSTGSSIGMGVVKTKAIGERTGQPLGAGMNFLRQVLLMVDFWICYVGVLWPLWDAKRQCLLSDKVASAIVIKVG